MVRGHCAFQASREKAKVLWAASRARLLFQRAKDRAGAKGLEFSLSQRDIVQRVASGFCEVTGIPFLLNHRSERVTQRNQFAPSLDRIDSRKGYTTDNVQVVVWIYNAAKGEGTHEEVMRMASALIRGAVILGA